MKVLSLFSGIGAFERALENLGIDFELVNYCEFDKFASKAYSILHNVEESKNLGDITKIDLTNLPKDIDLITYGFPCQDISNAGLQRGLEHNGEATRSGLVWKAHDIIKVTTPKYAICENVKALTGKKFTKEFKAILENLENMGYTNYWQVLNAKDYGVPQNRERVFIVSIRKDVDNGFIFPAKEDLKMCLADILDKEVDAKYYLSERVIKGFLRHNENHIRKGTGFLWKPKNEADIANCLRANASLGATDNSIKLKELTENQPIGYIVYQSENGCACTLKAEGGGLGAKTGLYLVPVSRNNGSKNKIPLISYNETFIMLPAFHGDMYTKSVRRLTPRECFALMGFNKADADKLSDNGISNTQLYKMAGNSIVVDVLEKIFKNLF